MKAYLYGVIIIAMLAAFAGTWFGGYRYGTLSTKDQVNRAFQENEKRVAKLLDELDKAKSEREVVYRDRVKIVKEAVGQCLDARIEPDDLLASLRNDIRSR